MLAPVLEEEKEKNMKNLTSTNVELINSSNAHLQDTFDFSKILKEGEIVPLFTLSNSIGQRVSLEDVLKTHKAVVLTWYRGGWCPYCNLALHSLIQINNIIEKHGAKLIALSPELPDESMSMKQKHDIPFTVLSDVHCDVADKFGIAFKMDDFSIKLLGNFGLDAFSFNGNNQTKNGEKVHPKLPLPATFVIDSNKKIVFKFAELDYTKRVEPQKIVDVLEFI